MAQEYRYEIGSDGIGVIDFASKFDQAIRRAESAISADIDNVYVFDRMARRGKPQLYRVQQCNGEAHRNPFIDHCGVCMPRWGYTVTPVLSRIK